MRPCPACATPNPEASKFCAECGARLPASAVDEEQRKTVTVLFSDVSGSTGLGERLEPESLRRMLATFFDAARGVIESHGGTVEKFIGDAVMAVFGVPLVHEDDAIRALRAAKELLSSVETLNLDLQRTFGAALQIRIGVNTGDVVTGTSERLATGDAVNVAARLEQLAAPGEILVGEVTAELAGAAATFDELDPVVLRGKSAPARVFRLVSAGDANRPVRLTPMVGRQRQLHMLRAVYAQALDDRACVLFTVLGAAGVGKSRLVAEFLDGLDAVVVRGRCLSYGQGIGLWPVVEVVRQLQAGPVAGEVDRILEQDEALAGAVRALVDGDVAVSSPTEIAWAVRRLFEQAAATQPLVVVLDDLHWAEEPLFELVEHVVALSRDAPILLLAMARPELLERRTGWAGGALNATTALLEPLGAEETAELVDRLSPSLDPTIRAKVQEASAGNPLFAEEMVALLDTSGAAEVRVPSTIRALLAARLDQLEPAELRVLERGSVEGQTFHRGAVAALAPDDADLPQRLFGLVRKDLLRPDRPTLSGDEAYRFRHLLLRDAAYERLPKSVRAELHERFARWLDGRAAELAERDHLVGYHLEQAYRYGVGLGPANDTLRMLGAEAAARLEAAGRREMDRSNLADAVNLLDRASSLAPRDKPDVSLELGIAGSLLMCGRPADALARAAAAEEAAAAAGDRIGALQAGLGRLAFGMYAAPDDNVAEEVQQLIDAALPEFEAAGNDAALAWCWWAIGHVAHNACRYGDGLEAGWKSQAYADRSGAPFLASREPQVPAHIALGPIPIPRALELLEELCDAGAGRNLWAEAWRAEMLAHTGRIDEARVLHAEVIAALQDRGMSLGAAILGQSRWDIELLAGDIDAAIAVARASCATLERMGERGWMSTNAAQLADGLLAAGNDDEAAHWASRALELGDASDAVTQAMARSVRARLAARRGDADVARAEISDVLAITADMQAPLTQGKVAVDAADVYTVIGDFGAAAGQLRRAIDIYTAKGATVEAALAVEALAALPAAP